MLRDDLADAPAHAAAGSTAWFMLLVDAALLFFASMYWLVQGRMFDARLEDAIAGSSWSSVVALVPDADRFRMALVRLAGTLGIVAGLALMAIASTAFRRGERWAWYVMWSLVVYPTLDLAVLGGYGALSNAVVVWDASMIALALLGLVVQARSVSTAT